MALERIRPCLRSNRQRTGDSNVHESHGKQWIFKGQNHDSWAENPCINEEDATTHPAEFLQFIQTECSDLWRLVFGIIGTADMSTIMLGLWN